MNDITFDDIIVVAKTVYGEARGELPLGRLAVAWVIRNRWESGKWFGRGTVTDVCLRSFQFSAWNENDPNRAKLEALSPDHPVYQLCLYAALGAMRGLEEDPTGGATHYFATRTTRPAWAKGKHGRIIGGHSFFTDID